MKPLRPAAAFKPLQNPFLAREWRAVLKEDKTSAARAPLSNLCKIAPAPPQTPPRGQVQEDGQGESGAILGAGRL